MSTDVARYICWSGIRGRGISVAFKSAPTMLDFYYREGAKGELWHLQYRNASELPYFPVRDSMPPLLQDSSAFLDALLGPLEVELFLEELRRVLASLPVWPRPHHVDNFVMPEGEFKYLHRGSQHSG